MNTLDSCGQLINMNIIKLYLLGGFFLFGLLVLRYFYFYLKFTDYYESLVIELGQIDPKFKIDLKVIYKFSGEDRWYPSERDGLLYEIVFGLEHADNKKISFLRKQCKFCIEKTWTIMYRGLFFIVFGYFGVLFLIKIILNLNLK